MSRLTLLATLIALTACDDVASEETAADAGAAEVVLEVRTRLGPEGGSLAGPPGTEWADFRLEVPPGALDAPTEVGLRPVFDGALLDPAAERVGVQVEVTADGDFAAPVRLILPFDTGAVGRVDQGPADVKVWIRADEGWTLVEPSATTEDTVTIELAAPTVAAAGVRLVAAPPTCADCAGRFATHRNPATCAESGLCVSDLPPAFGALGPAHIVSPRDRQVSWLLPSGSDLVAERLDPIEKTRMRGGIVSPRTTVIANPALGADGVVRVGLGSRGSARIPLDGGRATVRAVPALGAVSLGNGLNIVMELDVRAGLAIENPDDPTAAPQEVVMNHEEQFAPSVSQLPTLQPDPVNPDRAFVLSSGALYAFIVSPRDIVSPRGIVSPRNLARLAPAPAVPAGAPLALAAGPSGTLAATLDTRGRVLTYQDQGTFTGPTALDLPFPARDLAFSETRLVALSSTTPEIALIDLTARVAPRIFALTDAAPGTEAYTSALPRQIMGGLPGELLVRLTSGQIMVIAVAR